MKRFIFSVLAVAAVCCGTAMMYGRPKKVKVAAGQLERLVKPSDFKKADALEIAGTLNNTDLIYLRRLCGRDTVGTELPPLIKSLNIKNVKFERSGAPYFFKTEKHEYSVTSPHTLPATVFYQLPLENIVLPERLDTLGSYSLFGTHLTELSLPGNVIVCDAAIGGDSLLTELSLPPMATGLSPAAYNLPNLRSIRYSDIDYLPSGSFRGMPQLEEIIFDGLIGHIDGYQIAGCPKLKRVVFNGPIMSTGGLQFAFGCPALEEISVNSIGVGFGLVDNDSCPRLQGITVNGGIISSANTDKAPATPLMKIKSDPQLLADIDRLVDWQTGHLGAKGFLGRITRSYAGNMPEILDSLGLNEQSVRLAAARTAYRNPDDDKTKLQLLKEAAPYAAYTGDKDLTFSYALPSDSLLARSREYFNLDSIAGNGDDVSRIKNLLYWVHDLVRHDGSSSWPDCRFNLVDLHKVCQEQNRGLNCRFMAMMLTEALLAEGIPARYLTCQSKAYDEDSDCHVICIAWSDSLKKWIWVDPTFAAYVTDGDGLLLHPGEVRQRLREGLPLILNADANWNHKSAQTKEYYLDEYMAKNLYVISANLMQQSEPEGPADHAQGKVCALVPVGFDFTHAHYPVSDDSIFWAPPALTRTK